MNRWVRRSPSPQSSTPLKSNGRKRKSTRRRLRPETLENRQLMAANIFHNEAMPEDVNEDGIVSAVDALTIINQINQADSSGAGEPGSQQRGSGRMTDVNNDGRDSALDALMVINRLNRGDDGLRNPVDNPDTSLDLPSEDSPTDSADDSDLPTFESDSDVVLQWNDLFGEILASSVENQNPGYASRSMAMLNVAIFDAVALATDGADANTFYDYAIDFRGSTDNVTTEIVASQAAYTVLSGLYPDQQDTLDSFLAASLANYRSGDNTSDSIALGTEIGNEILASRADDGSDEIVQYTYSDEVGSFQADPLNPDVPVWGPGWGEVDTFAISSSDDYLPETTPALTSEEYAASYNEVKELGAADSTVRTEDQTEAGLFWAYDREGLGTPLALYNDVLLTIAVQQGNTLEENAALFAQASVAMADAAIVAWDTKFSEEFWRPVTAIQSGDIDGNGLTEGDADWTALGAPDGGDDEIGFTPQFPTYISGHATFGGALFGTLQEFYGTDDISFELTSRELEILLENPELQDAYGISLDDATRTFSSFSEAMAENGRSRVYLGIHFDFDDLVGQAVGQTVAATVASEFAALTGADSGSDTGGGGFADNNQGGNGNVGNNDGGDRRGNERDTNNSDSPRSTTSSRALATTPLDTTLDDADLELFDQSQTANQVNSSATAASRSTSNSQSEIQSPELDASGLRQDELSGRDSLEQRLAMIDSIFTENRF
ncbi:dockerin type I domain-containing protein [Rhodopirellula sp. ICT_H3.1]|uniref:Dockerin type I domain-containing protein n=2 Tax=Aporhodopirellula aestuarii TaxID=2950107 RepID=A0ABT0TWV3_9BACT|nr:dockerin type I domain-containing protein [Aporhodopirellula aestuarii]MCM2369096.1 dockerin type I domain-containing protein [Aporhodopirellula aestuarii]